MPRRPDAKWLRLRQLSRLVPAGLLPMGVPSGGWLSAIRQSLGMSRAQLAARMGIARQSVAALEQREADGGVTLEALRRAADAVECDLAYALVPRAGTFEALLEARAKAVAEARLGYARRTMALEAQPTSEEESAAQVEVLTRRLLAEWPAELWDTLAADVPRGSARQ